MHSQWLCVEMFQLGCLKYPASKCTKRIERTWNPILPVWMQTKDPILCQTDSEWSLSRDSIRFYRGRALTGVNYSAAREPRFVPYDVSSDCVDGFSPLPICPTTHEIQVNIENLLEDNKSDANGVLSIWMHNIAWNAEAEIKELLSLLKNRAPDIGYIHQNCESL